MAQGACTGGGHPHCSVSGNGKHVGHFVGEAGIERQFSHPTFIHSGLYWHLQQLLNLNFGGFFVFEVGGVIQGNSPLQQEEGGEGEKERDGLDISWMLSSDRKDGYNGYKSVSDAIHGALLVLKEPCHLRIGCSNSSSFIMRNLGKCLSSSVRPVELAPQNQGPVTALCVFFY